MSDPPSTRPAFRRILREAELWIAISSALVLLGRPLATGRTYFFRDLHLWSVPQRGHLGEIVRGGRWPLWDSLTHGGQPLLGDVNNLALYPTAALALVLDPVTAVNLEIALHFALAAAAMYAFARIVGMARETSLLASFVFAFSGISLSLANLLNRLFALPWMVLLVLFWHLWVRERRARWFLLAAAAGSLQLLAGSPESLLLSFPVAVGWSLLARYPADAPGRRERLAGALALAAVIVGLAAVQVAPMVEILRESRRARGLSATEGASWSFGPRRLPELVVPGFFGAVHTLDERDYWGAAQEDLGFPYLLSVYLGLGVCALTAGGIASRRSESPLPRALRLFLGAVSAGALILSLGRFLPLATVPGHAFSLALRYPSKFLLLLPLTVGLLAASGAEALRAGEPGSRAPARLATALGGAVAVALAVRVLLARGGPPAVAFEKTFFGAGPNPRAEAGVGRGLVHAAAAAAAMALVAWRGRWRQAPRGPGLVVAGVVGLDLLWAGAPVNATAPRSLLEDRPPLADAVRTLVADGRLYRGPRLAAYRLAAPSNDLYWLVDATRRRLLYNTATAFGIPVVYDDDFDGLTSVRVSDLTEAVSRLPWNRKLPLLSAGSVRAVVTDEPVEAEGLVPVEVVAALRQGCFLYRNDRAAAPAELVTFWRFAEDPGRARQAMSVPGFDPRRHAVVEGAGPSPSPGPCPRPAVRIAERSATSIAVETDSECPGFLVLTEPFAPGWRATLDGRPTPILPANGAFSAVFVPAGRHAVRRAYRPTALAAGAALSALTALGATVGARAARRR